MNKDILNEFGPDSSNPQKPGAGKGGETTARDVHNYKPPVGPKGIIGNERPGLGGEVHPCGTQGKR